MSEIWFSSWQTHCTTEQSICGYRNPFAAIWGGLDRDGVLWLTDEHYCREQPLSHHTTCLPRDVNWYIDPHGANERAELRIAGFNVKPGLAAIRSGIAAVQGRIKSGTLRIVDGASPNLLAEAGLYPRLPSSRSNCVSGLWRSRR